MKPYVTVKKFSKGLIFFSLVCLLITGILAFLNKNKIAADTAMPVTVSLNPIAESAPIHSTSQIPISILTNPTYYTDLDHVSIFVTRPGVTLNLSYTDANKSKICEMVNNKSIALVGISRKDIEGNWQDVIFDDFNTAGYRQLFGIALSQGGGCSSDIIKGWSYPTEESFIRIYEGQVATSGNIRLEVQTPVKLNTPFIVSASMTSAEPIDHISILILREGQIPYTSINIETVCAAAGNVRAVVQCNGRINCSGETEISGLSESGSHRIIGVGMRTSEPCASSNIIAFNKDTYVSTVSTSDPDGDGTIGGGSGSADDGGSGSGSSDTTAHPAKIDLKNPTKLNSVSDVFSKILYWIFSLVGVLSFLAFLYGGVTYLTAGADDQKANKAKKAMIFALIGLLITFLSYAFLRIFIFQEFLNKLNLPSAHTIYNELFK